MAGLSAGYYPTTYFAHDYWQLSSQYFPVYGAEADVPAPTVSTPMVPSGFAQRTPMFPLELVVTLDGELVWGYPIKLKKDG